MTLQDKNYDRFLFLVNSMLAESGFTKGQMADALGIARQHLSSVLSGKKVLTDSLHARAEALAKTIMPPGFFEVEGVNITDQLTPKARAILEMIAKVEGVSESEAMNRAIEEFAANMLQKNVKKDEPKTDGSD
jgi:transcriptional regulator with XRE-family HTH domain